MLFIIFKQLVTCFGIIINKLVGPNYLKLSVISFFSVSAVKKTKWDNKDAVNQEHLGSSGVSYVCTFLVPKVPYIVDIQSSFFFYLK